MIFARPLSGAKYKSNGGNRAVIHPDSVLPGPSSICAGSIRELRRQGRLPRDAQESRPSVHDSRSVVWT